MEIRLKEVMAERGMKSVELAERLGVTKQTVSNLINGRVMPSVETISKAADALGVPMWRLFASREDVASYLDMPASACASSSAIICPNCGHEIKIKVEQ